MSPEPTPMGELDRYEEAKAAIAEAFAAINAMPHGDGSHLADAQNHLAAARRCLDHWLADNDFVAP